MRFERAAWIKLVSRIKAKFSEHFEPIFKSRLVKFESELSNLSCSLNNLQNLGEAVKNTDNTLQVFQTLF